jgi:hypothetical protein
LVELLPEVLTGSGDARADGADRDAEVFGGLGVRLADYLGKHEGAAKKIDVATPGRLPSSRW